MKLEMHLPDLKVSREAGVDGNQEPIEKSKCSNNNAPPIRYRIDRLLRHTKLHLHCDVAPQDAAGKATQASGRVAMPLPFP